MTLRFCKALASYARICSSSCETRFFSASICGRRGNRVGVIRWSAEGGGRGGRAAPHLVGEQHRRLPQVQDFLLHVQVRPPSVLLVEDPGRQCRQAQAKPWSTAPVNAGRTTAATSSSRFIDVLSACSFSIAALWRRMIVCESSA